MIYAAYRGDEFVAVANSYYQLAAATGLSIKTVKHAARPTMHRRRKTDRALLVYRYEEVNND